MSTGGNTSHEGRRGRRERESAAVVTVDTRGTVTGWSKGAGSLLGYTAAQAVGRPAARLLASDPAETAAAVAALRRADVWRGTAAVRHRDGGRLELGLVACPLLDADGGTRGFVVTVNAMAQPPDADPLTVEATVAQAPVSMSAVDTEERYIRLNSAACGVLGRTEEELRGRFFSDTIAIGDHDSQNFLEHLRRVNRTGKPLHYESYTNALSSPRVHAWNIHMWPVRDADEQQRGVAVLAFDSSEQYWARQRLLLLKEAGTAIGTTLDVVRTAEELAQLAVPVLGDYGTVDLLDSVMRGEEPTEGPVNNDVRLRRVSHKAADPRITTAAVELGGLETYPESSPPARCLTTGRPALSRLGDPGFTLWIGANETRAAMVRERGVHSLMAIPLRARGITLGVAVFTRAQRAEPFEQDDVVLAEELASRAAVCIDNARRYTREHTTALALQRSLLTQRMPGQNAVEFASRYLPAGSRAGVGGDWFDVIPLSGNRVALVVGDVVGHGIHASAAMGRLRTAVRTLADVDLPPDELLTHLDDLVSHLAEDDDAAVSAAEATGEFGATCLYAVYDPVSRSCAMASAGHLPPAVRLPDGTVELFGIVPGPPLGVGAVPFEVTERELPEGSVLALCTDGLIVGRDRDVDAGLQQLCEVLAAHPDGAGTPDPRDGAGPGPDSGEPGSPEPDSLEALCDRVMSTLLPDRPTDDAALLVTRTRALHSDQVASWELTGDPAQVADARDNASAQLAAWGLTEAAFVTELVVSELVTNAIRYGADPIRLRLIRDRTLICEVSDGSSTAPHLRRAHAFDEGGRGLLLVAQLTQSWGTRQTASGKTIWAEQVLTPLEF
ncbi:SpoIIE family protein phosphatase [Streptomyces sp. NPDC091212]|uniref:SpoIIE family protein phosphatase n=1 Tax=Streptomyces sp. NPDC091212 TaxID=3155191 RepID=UPI00341B8BB7